MRSVLFLLVFVFLIEGVLGISGVSPGSYEVDFEPGLNEEFIFEFIFDEGVSAEIYVEGDLSRYVVVDKELIMGSEKVTAILNLPEEVSSPGQNRIRIGARQVASEEEGIGIVADVRGIIKLNVPYPGRYLELDLIAPNANAGDELNLTLKAINRGEETIYITPLIEIFKENEKIDELSFEFRQVVDSEEEVFIKTLDTENYSAGNYLAIATADYGESSPAKGSDLFRLGELYVRIFNYTSFFEDEGGDIRDFNIEVESYYNEDIEGLYAEVKVLDFPEANFITPSINLDSWRNGTLKGFLDTSTIDEEEFSAEITLHYEGEVTKETVNLELDLGIDYTLYFVIFVLIVVLLLTAWRVFSFVRNMKTVKKSGKSNK